MEKKTKAMQKDCKYLFLDRDGVINVRKMGGYITDYSEFCFIDGVKQALKIFAVKFERIFIVTNQQGIGKGLFTKEDFDVLTDSMIKEISENGGRIDRVYMCPNLKSDNSPMRKPEVGMGLKAKEDFPEVDFSKSVMVGDSNSDMLFGKNLGMYNVFVDNHTGEEYDETIVNEKYNSLLSFAESIDKD